MKSYKIWLRKKATYVDFYQTILRPEGYCRCLCLSVCLFVPLPICRSVRLCPSVPLIGERQEAQILKFNAPPTHLVCHVHLMANFLSFHMSLVVVVNCGAGNALRGFEISMFYFFLKLYFIHISKDILLLRAQNAIKQCKWCFSRKPYCQWLLKCKIGKPVIIHGCTPAPYIMHDL